MYRFRRTDWADALERWGLSLSLNLAPDTPISDLIKYVQHELENGPHQYQFAPPRRLHSTQDDPGLVLSQEPLGLCLLGLRNNGRIRDDGHVRLQAYPSYELTIQDLLSRPTAFAHNDHCVQKGTHFIVRLGKYHSPIFIILLCR